MFEANKATLNLSDRRGFAVKLRGSAVCTTETQVKEIERFNERVAGTNGAVFADSVVQASCSWVTC